MRWTTPDPVLCKGFESSGMFHKSYPSVTAAKIHIILHSPACKAAALSFWELRVEATRSDAMAGGSDDAGPAPDVWHQPLGISGIFQVPAVKKEVGIGISLDQPGMFWDMLHTYSIYTCNKQGIDKIYHRYTIVITLTTGLILQIYHT